MAKTSKQPVVRKASRAKFKKTSIGSSTNTKGNKYRGQGR